MGYDLRLMSCKAALLLAKETSGLNNEQIAMRSGVPTSMTPRYFDERQPYFPSLFRLPSLCSAMGNTILLEWVKAQLEEFDDSESLGSAEEVFREVNRLAAHMGHVHAALEDSINGEFIDPTKAHRLAGELHDVETRARKLRGKISAWFTAVVHKAGHALHRIGDRRRKTQ